MNNKSDNLNNHQNEDNVGYSLLEFYYIGIKYTKLILLSIFFIVFSAIVYTFISKPVYLSSGTIMVSQDLKSMSMLDMSLGNDRNYIENEIEILKSRTTSNLVIKELLKSVYAEDLYLLNTKRYKPIFYREYLTLGLLDKFQETINLDSAIIDQNFIDDYSQKLLKTVSFINKRNTDAITITVESFNALESQILVNTIMDVYMKRDLEWITNEMSHLKVFLIDQLNKKEKELNKVEDTLKAFQESQKIYGLDQNSKLLLEKLTKVEIEYNTILSEIEILNQKEIFLNNQLSDDEKYFSKNVSNTINERLFAMKLELSNHESELIRTIAKYDENHTAVFLLNKKIKKLKDSIGIETNKLISRGISVANPILYRQSLMDSVISLESYKSELESKAIAYKKLVDSYDLELRNLPEKVLQYTRLERDRSILSETYAFMRSKLEESKIGEASKLGKIRIIDRASFSNKPISPNKFQNVLVACIVGILLGCGLALIIEFFNNTIKTVEQIERRNLSVLAIIPAIENYKKGEKHNKRKYLNKNSDVQKLQRRLITEENPKSPISESYRSLRTSLMYDKNKKDAHVILVSSAGPGEGKTTTIANLAITYANLGKKTLLIDSDLRKPVIHNVFKIDKTPGLTSYLSMNSNSEEIINHSNIDNLDIMTSGVIPPNPSELLESNQMSLLIEKLRIEYDVVLFDSPPLIAVTDAYILMKYIDQFVLVVRAGVTEKGALERVLSALDLAKQKITGVVMNAMTEEYSYGSGYYYNYYQYYYSEDKK